MQVRLINLRLPVEAGELELARQISQRLGIKTSDLGTWRILRKSLDARSKRDMQFVYTISVQVADDPKLADRLLRKKDVDAFIPETFDDPPSGSIGIQNRPVVVGAGPAGLLAGYYLAVRGYRPLIIERGYPVKERVPVIRKFDREHAPHDEENNYLFGEGGAGCFSDGKLTCRMSGADVEWTFKAFIECGGPESILYDHRPHLGSNKLPMICRNFRRRIEELGGEYRFACRLESIDIQDGQVVGIGTSGGPIPTQHLILATGHSARDTYEMLHGTGIPMEAKAFQLGLRIEQPQANINAWKYGKKEYADLLGAADYSIIAKGDRDLFTFCMCAGGYVIPSVSESGQFCTNGMSNSRHDTEFANSGMMVTLEPHLFGSSHPLAGMELQRKFEAVAFSIGEGEYYCPIQRVSDFLNERVVIGDRKYPGSYERGTISSDLRSVLPTVISNAIRAGLPIMDEKWRGKFLKDAMLVGPEMRGSAPLRMDRDRVTKEAPGIAGLYPVGEGAGYAGGIVSAAVDGLRSAREIVRRFAALK
ncbi:NAD(P)/FAD-dependent oxidoreductase [Planctomicrobium sp. SH527]|uniref:NAD(P)/FAD-dependent oxidoreductase n=1 Tax=Planctomicrobium sp. SH527 TaxID=3448123 RepID=UPI003F5BD740